MDHSRRWTTLANECRWAARHTKGKITKGTKLPSANQTELRRCLQSQSNRALEMITNSTKSSKSQSNRVEEVSSKPIKPSFGDDHKFDKIL
ncbi:hypothetical protein JCGZ_05205 [Jatropha curcas]|uniref:Uncharacterized protein n=1 Tax=Jatropha curcas TaxID=180498 RepID=A0A067KZS3_JATCU|nr:hypothetical protein JCGZ_05205 [Jatropha curcas]